jgi:hypothetical protein
MSIVNSLFKTVLKKVNSDVSISELTSGLTDVSHLELSYSVWGYKS